MARKVGVFLKAVGLGVAFLLLVGWGEVRGQTGSDLGVVRAVETYRLGQFDEARGALERSLQGRLSESDRAVALAYLGLIEMAVGQDPARFFREAVLADPTLELDPAAHAPARIQRFDEIRRRLLEVATIEVVLGADTIEVGGETTVGVRVLNTEGQELRGLPVRYTTQGPAELAVVGGADRVRGRQAGEVMVMAELSLLGLPRRVSKLAWVVDTRPATRASDTPTGDQGRLGAEAFALGVGLGEEQFASIPAGSFRMGSTSGTRDERPVHTVVMTRAFYLQKTEVTQGQWKAVMGRNPSHFANCGDICPVERVSWNDIQSFLAALNNQEPGKNYRLPTEAEWEDAARAGATEDYGESGVLHEMGWYEGNSSRRTHPVAQKLPNAWGLYDMHGNVWEWVQDWYSDAYYSVSPINDPAGPPGGSSRVMRGGSWGSNARSARPANRDHDVPTQATSRLGFRLAKTQ